MPAGIRLRAGELARLANGSGPGAPRKALPMDGSAFGEVIVEHLELQRRNRGLEQTMPLERYVGRSLRPTFCRICRPSRCPCTRS